MRPRFLTVCLFAIGLLAPALPSRGARAEATAADLESARDLYKLGKALRDKGDLVGALEKFKAAHALANTPITAVEYGRTLERHGELVEARDVFLSVARIPAKANESANTKSARAEADKLAEELKARLPSLVVTIAGVPSDTVTLLIDGVAIPHAAIGEPRKLNPGLHVVRASVEGAPEKRLEVTLAEKEQRSVVVTLEPPPAPAEPVKPTKPVETPKPLPDVQPASRGLPALTWIGISIALAGAATGTVTGLTAWSRARTAKESCVDGACPPSVHSMVDSGKTFGNISTTAFVVAGLGAGVAVFGLLSRESPSERAAARVRPVVGLGSFHLVGEF